MKIKILYIGYSSNLGGIETYLLNIIDNMNMNEFDVSIMKKDKKKQLALEDELKSKKVKIYSVTSRKENFIKYLKDLKELFKNNSFDYIHINIMDYGEFELIKYAIKYSKAKVIVHSHSAAGNKLNLPLRIYDSFGRKILANKKIIRVACGNAAGEYMFGNKKYEVFNNGVDYNLFKYDDLKRKEIRKKYKINDDQVVLGLIARISYQKNQEFLIDIFSEYNKRVPNSILLIIGGGEKDFLENKIEKLNIKDKVIFTGMITDAYKYYSAFDLFVMPSRYEGFAISLIEAQLNGLKCYVSTRISDEANITNRVEFISLEKSSKEWADIILNKDNNRDANILSRVNLDFRNDITRKKVYDFYKQNK